MKIYEEDKFNDCEIKFLNSLNIWNGEYDFLSLKDVYDELIGIMETSQNPETFCETQEHKTLISILIKTLHIMNN